tara:strand:- start:681 stop:1019 length:339 start_codon:yes stop_codon:yes gene_type:complete
MVEIEESWMQRIRDIAPVIEKTEYEVFRCDAEVKKLHATLKMKALADGMKTSSAQETWAESQQELYLARLKVGVAKGSLSALKITLKSLEVGFEEWRTKMVNAREERKRYGA